VNGWLQGRQQGFWSRQRLARTSAEVSTLLTCLTFPATFLTWSIAFWLVRVPVSATTPRVVVTPMLTPLLTLSPASCWSLRRREPQREGSPLLGGLIDAGALN
jgi:hypothetical protein